MTDQDRLVAGRYRLGERIGAGAMGVVWRAHDERLRRTVAVKQLLLQPGLDAARNEEARFRAMREARIAARLQHPYAVSVYDVAEDDDQPWLIMEYVPSRSLAAEIAERGPLPPARAARIGRQVAAALAAAHAVGVVHRDVKPGNVLLADDGCAKITDFGISRAVDDVVLTATGLLAGTPAYLSPEVARGAAPAPPSDVFALGSTLYAAVEGTPPFGLNENPFALLHAVAAGRVPPPANAGPLTDVLMRLLAAEPGDRPTMREAETALAEVAGRGSAADGSGGDGSGGGAWGGGAAVDSGRAWTTPVPPVPVAGRATAAGPPAGPLAAGPVAAGPASPAGGLPGTRFGAPATFAGVPAARRRPGRVVLVVLVAAVLIGAGAFVLARAMSTGGAAGAGAAGASGSTVAGSSAPGSSAAGSSAAPTPVDGAPTFAAMRDLVRTYYGLLPGDVDGAWRLLSTRFQQQSNLASYRAFYTRTVATVSVADIRSEGGNVVTAVVTFTTVAQVVTHEPYRFSIVREGGALVIDTAARYGPRS